MVHKYPKWALKYKGPSMELRLAPIKNGVSYYLYKYYNKYDSERKCSVRIKTEFIGRITEKDGLINTKVDNLKSKIGRTKHQIVEYGGSQFISARKDRIDTLKKCFPDNWQKILCIIYTRFLYQAPIKRMSSHIQKSFLWHSLHLAELTEKDIHNSIKEIGLDRTACTDYMKTFINKKDYLLIDATEAAYNSKQCYLSQFGKDANNGFQEQYNLLYLYSQELNEPIFYRILRGNVREVRSIANIVREAQVKDVTMIGDKGFYSSANIGLLKEIINIKYIFPLKRNSKFLNYEGLGNSKDKKVFKYLDRYIWYKEIKTKNEDNIFIYLNPQMKAEEEKDYLNRIKDSENEPDPSYSFEKLVIKEKEFGTLSLITNRQDSAEDIYSIYKSRLQIEQSFDLLKNILDIDGPYMRTPEMLNGWMFLNHVSLQLCYDILALIQKKKLSKRISIPDILSLFKDTRACYYNDQWNLEDMIDRDKKIYRNLDLKLPDYAST